MAIMYDISSYSWYGLVYLPGGSTQICMHQQINNRNTVLQTLPHSFLKLSPTTMLYIPLTEVHK